MWALSCLFQANLYREKVTLICSREYSSVKRLNAFPTAQVGVEMAEEALSFFSAEPHRHVMEHAFCRLIMGWLLWQCGDLNSENTTTFSYTQLLERGIAQLEKGLTLFEQLLTAEEAAKGKEQAPGRSPPSVSKTTSSSMEKVKWSNLPATRELKGSGAGGEEGPQGGGGGDFQVPFHPHHHRRVLLTKKPIFFYVGLCYSLLGQAYYGLCTEGDVTASKGTLYMAYENLTDSLKLKYGMKDSPFWVESRFLLASIVLKDPSVLEDSSASEAYDPVDDPWHGEKGGGPVGLAPLDFSAEKKLKAKGGGGGLPPVKAELATPPDNNMAIEVRVVHVFP